MPSCSSAFPPARIQPPDRLERPGLEDWYRRAGKLAPWFGWAAALSFVAAVCLVFAAAPTESVRGEHHRIAFIHGPATWISVLLYLLTTGSAAFGLIAGQRLSSMLASALAPTGAMFAFVSLWTVSLWGKPVWGVWWIWDAHLSSELLLLFLFLGFIALREAIDDNSRADRATGVLGLAGLVALPVLHVSVRWWTSHQGLTFPDLRIAAGSGVTGFVTMMTMSASLACYALAAALTRLRVVILERERNAVWVSREQLR